jgi:monoamine oxidase
MHINNSKEVDLKGMYMDSTRFSIPLNNPSDEQRHQLLKNALNNVGRPEDFQNIIDLLSPPPDITNFAEPGTLNGIKIGIIGGGLAGCSAAFELRKLGADITIFDALEDRIGGRVYTYYFDRDRQYFGEFGPMRIPVSHETTWHYINLFHLNTESLSSPNSNNFIYVHNTRIRRDKTGDNVTNYLYPKFNLTNAEKSLPWSELNEYAFDYLLNNLSPDVRTEILKILPSYSADYANLSSLSDRQVFEMLGLSQDAITLIASVDPLTGGLINNSYDETLQDSYSLDFLNTYRIAGGMVNLPLAFYYSLISRNPTEYDQPDYLLGDVHFKYGHFVNGIYQSLQRNKVLLRYSTKAEKNMLELFDYIICTIPFSTLREIEIKPFFSNQKMQAIRELNYSSSQKTAFFCNHRFWEDNASYGNMNGGISFTDLPIQSIAYPPDHINCLSDGTCSSNDPGVLLASYNFNLDSIRLSNQNDKRRFELIKRNVEEVHGLPTGYLDTIVKDHKTVHWNTEPWFRGAFAINLPGQKINFAYNMLQPEFENKVFFAGEHTSVKHGWMQGSLYSGNLAANTLVMHHNGIMV